MTGLDSNLKYISGFEELASLFENSPSFDDAEVVEMILNRGNTLKCASKASWNDHQPPSLKVTFHIFDNQYNRDDLKANAIYVHLKFIDIQKLDLERFEHQNPVSDFSITESFNQRLQKNMFRVSWGGSGHEVSFICEQAIYLGQPQA